MQPEGSLPRLQEPTTCPYSEPNQSRPCPSSSFLKIHFNIILPYPLGSSKWSLFRMFPQNPACISSLPIHSTCSAHLILIDLFTRIIFREEYRSLSSSLCVCLNSLVSSSLLGPNILLNTLLSYTLSLRSSLNVNNQVAQPYKTTDKIIAQYVVIFIFFNNKVEDTRFSTEW